MEQKVRQIIKYLQVLNEKRYHSFTEIHKMEFCLCEYKTGHVPPPLSQFSPFKQGEFWGDGNDSHAWFHFFVEAKNDCTYLEIKTEHEGRSTITPQFIVYVNGKQTQGMDTNHTEVLLPANTVSEIYLYGYTAPQIKKAQLFVNVKVLDERINELYYDILYPFESLFFLNAESGEYAQVLKCLNTAVSILDLYDTDSEEFQNSVVKAHEYLQEEFYGKYCREQSATTVCIGHTHIDCAWLWTLRQTREKVQRSFATVLELMKRYPFYKFTSSQALLYKYFKEESPDLYEELKERVKEKRWEVEGSMWVEADCNLSSGESLIRQIVYGKEFFRNEFGVENKILWLPDVFGYSAALPQILKKCGVEWFFTSKISWNDTNRMPYDVFKWKGIDGTEINSYFLTAQEDKGLPTGNYADYVGHTGAKWISGAYKRFQQKNLSDEVLLTYGYGDGGGGPTAEQLELLKRGDKGFSGVPNAKPDFVGEFFKRLDKRIENNPALPKWQGELYLEFHRGTYTTMAANKKNNRKSEFLFENAELYGVIAETLCSIPYPQERLRAGWEKILTNQFHDIIPGSSIAEVYEDSNRDYAEIFQTGNHLLETSYQTIAENIEKSRGYVIFNPNSFSGDGFVRIDGVCALVRNAAPKGYFTTKEYITNNGIRIDGQVVETNVLRVEFDDEYQIKSIFDKNAGRELIKGGAGNELRLYGDYPDDFDAWEWQIYSKEKYKTIGNVECVEVLDDGARRGVKISRRFNKSTFKQTVWFYDDITKIDFETYVDWHERHVMLKTAFPVDVNTDKATYEIQFGTIERPTHFNTSWDKAKFEVCAHKYADISEGDYGISIINDCKYGHDIHDGVMQLSLLRAPTYPNPEADQGEHFFTYSIYPHKGRLNDCDTVRLAYQLNNPMIAVKATGEVSTIEERYSLISFDKENVICETAKKSEDETGYVFRLYECQNKRTNLEISFGIPVSRIYVCNMLEDVEKELKITDGKVQIEVSGYEILTLKAEM